jgi:anti-sigma factor RsiW
VTAWLDGELSPAMARAVEARIAADPPLAFLANRLRRLRQSLGELPRVSAPASTLERTRLRYPAIPARSGPETQSTRERVTLSDSAGSPLANLPIIPAPEAVVDRAFALIRAEATDFVPLAEPLAGVGRPTDPDPAVRPAAAGRGSDDPWLTAWLDEELTPVARQAVERKLARSPRWRRVLVRLQRVCGVLGGLPTVYPDLVRVEAGLKEIRAAIRADRTPELTGVQSPDHETPSDSVWESVSARSLPAEPPVVVSSRPVRLFRATALLATAAAIVAMIAIGEYHQRTAGNRRLASALDGSSAGQPDSKTLAFHQDSDNPSLKASPGAEGTGRASVKPEATDSTPLTEPVAAKHSPETIEALKNQLLRGDVEPGPARALATTSDELRRIDLNTAEELRRLDGRAIRIDAIDADRCFDRLRTLLASHDIQVQARHADGGTNRGQGVVVEVSAPPEPLRRVLHGLAEVERSGAPLIRTVAIEEPSDWADRWPGIGQDRPRGQFAEKSSKAPAGEKGTSPPTIKVPLANQPIGFATTARINLKSLPSAIAPPAANAGSSSKPPAKAALAAPAVNPPPGPGKDPEIQADPKAKPAEPGVDPAQPVRMLIVLAESPEPNPAR